MVDTASVLDRSICGLLFPISGCKRFAGHEMNLRIFVHTKANKTTIRRSFQPKIHEFSTRTVQSLDVGSSGYLIYAYLGPYAMRRKELLDRLRKVTAPRQRFQVMPATAIDTSAQVMKDQRAAANTNVCSACGGVGRGTG